MSTNNTPARTTILSKIRDKIGDNHSALNAGLVEACPDFSIALPQPDYGFDIEANKTDYFVSMLQQVHGSCEILPKLEAVPDAVAGYLTKSAAPLHAVIAGDEKLTRLNWANIVVEARVAEKSDHTSITLACAGIAESGSIVMLSSPQSPVTLNFLPEINIVILLEARLLATMEQFWPQIKTQPRAINFITGPSKTADIEQTLVYGAHGPKQLHVIIVKNPSL